jgi:serine/threonine protein phosphatase PrpC
MELLINIPKKEGAGEDAPALYLSLQDGKFSIIGVFDGMGGSGSALYEENGETHTGAYIASRLVKETTEKFFKEKIHKSEFVFTQNNVDELKNIIVENLRNKLKSQQYKESKLKSSLIRTFPTTLAVGLIVKQDENLKMNLLWAGDSRIYLLSMKKGLVQLTKDDLKLNNDPFQNIENDSPLSNMINLDEGFKINFKEIEDNYPTIVLAVTDGCFGYYPTPMHFEHLLLQTMQEASSVDEWKQKIIERLQQVSGDDCSMSIVYFDKKEMKFVQLKDLYKSRNEIFQDFMNEISKLEQSYTELKNIEESTKKLIAQNENERKELHKNLWSKYKNNNYSFYNIDIE